ncbi:hypothetical protein [Paenibacillus sp. 32352]|uniref:hypothetical protein n=1 Tax=Paenibacillus sp. 32352 TaxID=1969111 RepID=UPI0009AE94CB|nr:hypothetical protein [Paenibacillus sp. 32352]
MLSQHLEDQLNTRFPWAKETTIYTDDGWYQIIWNMFEELDPYSSNLQLIAINEKYGSMDIEYHGNPPSAVLKLFEKYEVLSETTCEICGGIGGIKELNGWLNVYCDPCFELAQAEHLRKSADRKEKLTREFNGLCCNCGSTGSLREIGVSDVRGYCDPCYEEHFDHLEYLNFRGGLIWKDEEQLRNEILQRYHWAEARDDDGNGLGRLAPFYCRKGWYLLIWRMLSEIEKLFNEQNLPVTIHLNDISEKYGEMRVWVSNDIIPDLVQRVVNKYEKLSRVTCKECGERGSNQNMKLAPYCEAHLISEMNRKL